MDNCGISSAPGRGLCAKRVANMLLKTPIAAGTCFAAGAGAASAARYPKRVQDLLNYVRDHPAPMTGIPMEYEARPAAPVPSVVQGLKPQDVLPPGAPANDLATVIAALLYLAAGCPDQAHNLVTPLSWGSPTHYGGRPVAGSPAAQEAAYVHALVHRQEGPLDGEFGSGWSNANYWHSAAGQHAVHGPLLAAAKQAAAGNAAAESFVAGHGERWEPHRFVSLCAKAVDAKDAPLLAFCHRVADAEWRLLLDHCYSRLQR